MVEIGQKVRFDPFMLDMGVGLSDLRGNVVTGTVVYVNEDHKWFSVEFGNPTSRTSFNFADIDKVVEICG